MDLPPPVNHVFVDFENVQDIDLTIIGEKTVHFTLLVGPKQTRLDTALVEKLLQHSAQISLIRLAAPGRNALDFTLAYYVGRAVAADPTGYFHIISKDKGYEPFVEHLRNKHVKARRYDDFTKLTFSAPPKVKPVLADDPIERILTHLRKNATNRPKRQKTLITNLAGLFAPKKSDADVLLLIAKLQTSGKLSIDGKGAVSYSLD